MPTILRKTFIGVCFTICITKTPYCFDVEDGPKVRYYPGNLGFHGATNSL